VAVDQGVEWKGVRVYLSLTFELLAVDAASGKTLWAESVGAFWTRVGFKELNGAWAVELGGEGRTQRHDLRTGKKIDLPAPPPAGQAFKPLKEYFGDRGNLNQPFRIVVTTRETWDMALDRLFGARVPIMDEVDFDKAIVLIVSDGELWNCAGVSCEGAWEDDTRVLLRLRRRTYSTGGPAGGGVRAWPFGIFVLPRRPGKALVVELNTRSLKAGPPVWEPAWRLDKLPDPDKELEALPER
jgi:hypothetical protein